MFLAPGIGNMSKALRLLLVTTAFLKTLDDVSKALQLLLVTAALLKTLVDVYKALKLLLVCRGSGTAPCPRWSR